MSAQDYRVNAEARRLLVSRWIDVSILQVGTTNGVIYVLGHLDTTMEDPTRRQDEKERKSAVERAVHLAASLDKELRRLRDVRDVVFRLDNVVKRGGRWRAADGTLVDTKARRDARTLYIRPEPNLVLEDTEFDADDGGER